MITMKEWMELVDYKITEGGDYGWGCYGANSYTLDSWNGVHGKGGYSFSIIFSTKSQKVYEVSMCDYTNDRAYRMINPKFQKKHDKEAEMRDVNLNEANMTAIYSIAAGLFEFNISKDLTVEYVPRMREQTDKLPGWKFLEKYVYGFSPFHLNGGLARSNLKFHNFH